MFANLLSVQQGLTRCYYADDGFTTPITSANYTTDQVYCNWAAYGFRLPSEGEREYFTRAGTTSPFSVVEPNFNSGNCGDCSPIPALSALDSVAWWCGNSTETTHPVGMKNPNPWNLKDVHGNVSELCWDKYDLYPAGNQTDYRNSNFGPVRATRGGLIITYWWAATCRSAFRFGEGANIHNYFQGFRLVRTLP